jgi:methyl-accepting chemotaxis protein
MTELHIKRPLWMTMTACGFAAVLFASAAIGGLALYRQSAAAEQALHTRSRSDMSVIQTDMDAVKRSASALAQAMAGDPAIADLILANDRTGILAKYMPGWPAVVRDGGLQTLTVLDGTGTVIARAHTPDKFGENITSRRKTVVAALSTGKLASGIEQGRTAISMYASAPVIRDGKVIGVVDIGTELTNAYFQPLADRLGAEIAVDVIVDGKVTNQASTESSKSMLADAIIQSALDGQSVFEKATLDGRDMILRAVPFSNFSGDKIGVIEIGTDASEVVLESRQSLWIMIGVTLAISLLALLGFLWFARSLAGAIARLTGTMSSLASGNLSAEVEGDRRSDEIGAMAKAVQVFKDNGLKTRELERHADEQRNQSEEQRRTAAERDQARSEAMAQATNGLADGLKHLASGDLTFNLDRPFAEDFESLRADFNRAVEQLRSTLSGVADASGSIDSGAREVSQSADDLSKRTEQQAASLEETAAALDEITANVTNSSKRVDEARSVAIQANDSARQSGTVVANAVTAMGKIEQSSSQISNIIGVIDDIAFQTNLLALNAGVEAARAGEAGKGFAVVAQEVRELAQRSAKAAKEIKELIRNSSVEVGTGVKLVSETGEALKTIESYIVTINQHMDAIATSAREQSVGLSEVNTAVNQMDQVTQQNAAMVEEANAAGATLASEAGHLRSMISQFQLGQSGQFQGGQSRHAPGNGGRAFAPAAAPRRASVVPAPAFSRSAPVSSPARGMVGKLAQAFGGRGSVAPAVSNDSWEEF